MGISQDQLHQRIAIYLPPLILLIALYRHCIKLKWFKRLQPTNIPWEFSSEFHIPNQHRFKLFDRCGSSRDGVRFTILKLEPPTRALGLWRGERDSTKQLPKRPFSLRDRDGAPEAGADRSAARATRVRLFSSCVDLSFVLLFSPFILQGEVLELSGFRHENSMTNELGFIVK